MGWLVKTPKDYQRNIEKNNFNDRGVDTLNAVFRFMSKNRFTSEELKEQIRGLDGENFPHKVDVGRHRGTDKQILVKPTDQILFPGREFKPYFSRYWIAHNTDINEEAVRNSADLLRVLTGKEEWKLIQKAEPNAVYYRLNQLNLFELTKTLFEEEMFELDEELEEGLKIFVKHHFTPHTLLEKRDGELYFTLLKELLIEIKHLNKEFERRNGSADEIMAGAWYLGIEDLIAPDYPSFESDKFVRFLQAVYTRYRNNLPSRENEDMETVERCREKMIYAAIGHEIKPYLNDL